MLMPAITRRHVLSGMASTVAVAPFIGRAWAQGAPKFSGDPFSLGVASGDPDANSVVLWTRLAPQPLQPNSGMPSTPIPVEWEIAEDDKMQKVLRRGTAQASPDEGHSLHIIADGLAANRPYWYRFIAGGIASPIGRTRTLPERGVMPDRFRLVSAGCQRIERGFFTAWADIARSDIDLVYHYGDYIYEYELPADVIAKRMSVPVPGEVLKKADTLARYRLRYALYKLDPDLAAAHAAHPFIASFDDHEVINDWGGMYAPGEMSQRDYLALLAAGFQAFYENSPVRPQLRPSGPNIAMYRAFDIGGLLRLAVLDTRQYRSLPACGKSATQSCDERFKPERGMIGADQESWLLSLFDRRDTAWTVLGNQVAMMQLLRRDPKDNVVDTDKWDGNPAARARLLQGAVDRKVEGLIALTGDIHRSIAGDLKVDYDKPASPTAGVELITTSISSDGDGGPPGAAGSRMLSNNPHLKYFDSYRGYLVCDFAQQKCEARYRSLNQVSDRGGKVTDGKAFTLDAKKTALG